MRDEHEVERVLDRCMTAKQLIGQLEDLDPDARVFFVCDYGDYHRTQQALPVEEVIGTDSSALRSTAYSGSGVCMIEDDGKDDDKDEEDEEEEVETHQIAFLR